jgi:hypothetical protein
MVDDYERLYYRSVADPTGSDPAVAGAVPA